MYFTGKNSSTDNKNRRKQNMNIQYNNKKSSTPERFKKSKLNYYRVNLATIYEETKRDITDGHY